MKDLLALMYDPCWCRAGEEQLVVLIDAASSSEAEIFARTIQLEKRGIVIGDRSAGLPRCGTDPVYPDIYYFKLGHYRSPGRVDHTYLMYRSLNSEKIVDTIGTLCRRIDERFPDSGLAKVCRELLTIAGESQERSAWIAKPHMALRVVTWLVLIIMAAGLIAVMASAAWPRDGFELVGLVQGVEAALNITILFGAAALFLITVEVRMKRKRALKAIHELRALAHVIDMHQLTKDPERLRTRETASSPKRTLRAPELVRYLDYCSEMLSLIGKIAALYVQKFDDPVALAAVNEVEELTTGLSRKIWQKIMILNVILAEELV